MTWLDGIIDEIDMNLGTLWEMVWDREARRAAIYGGHEELDTTGKLNNSIVEDGVKWTLSYTFEQWACTASDGLTVWTFDDLLLVQKTDRVQGEGKDVC